MVSTQLKLALMVNTKPNQHKAGLELQMSGPAQVGQSWGRVAVVSLCVDDFSGVLLQMRSTSGVFPST